jgi:outer membrane receptor protein involved in Fe transport
MTERLSIMKRTFRLLLVSLFLVLALSFAVSPAEGTGPEKSGPSPMRFALDEIVVTAARVEERISDVAKNVTVISGEDILRAPGSDLVDLLAKEPGLHVRRSAGSPRQAALDIRGMGDTAASAVVVMIDGLKVNSPDLSGQNLSSVPLSAIERIEIVRGAGSVIYGNGAVGGVINIITKKDWEGGRTGSVSGAYGSYDTYDISASYADMIEDFRFAVNAARHDSERYRDNGFYRTADVSADTGYTLSERFDITLAGAWHEDAYGLPGPVSLGDIESTSRRKNTDYPEDEGETREYRARAGVSLDLGDWGEVSVKRGYRFRDNRFVIGYTPLLPRQEQEDEIDEESRQLDIGYSVPFTLMGRTHRFQLGADLYQTHYVREEFPAGPRKNSETESFGVFVNNRWALPKDLSFAWGLRYNTYEGKFRTDARQYFPAQDERLWVNGPVRERDFDNTAAHAGLTWQYQPGTRLYASYATSFRIPNVDEFAEAEPGLSPQEGRHLEVGASRRFGASAEISLGLYDIRIDDEIYYSEINRNYGETTVRQGIEVDGRFYPAESIRVWANYTYTKAEFEGSGNTVPLVPRHKVSMGIDWEAADALTLSLSGLYTGSQHDGNDIENNRYRKLDPYTVFDARAGYTRGGGLEFYATVDNIFNELYATSAYSESYYPMPERNFSGGIRWRF